MLLNGEGVTIKEQLYLPYQLTYYYQNELVRFQEAFEERMNECKRRIFEQQQHQQYNDALILEGEQQKQEQQQHINT